MRPEVFALAALAVACSSLPAFGKGPPPAFKIGSKFSRSLQKYTGINALTSMTASTVATLVARHELGGGVKVKVKTYSLTDLIAGKVKSVDVKLKHSSYKGAPLGDVRVKTQNPLWFRYLKKDGQKPGVLSPVNVSISGNISETELGKALRTDEVSSKLRMIKLDLPGVGQQQLQLLDPKVDFSEGSVKVDTLLVTKGAARDTGIYLTVMGKPLLTPDSRILLQDIQIASPDIPNPEDFSSLSQQLLNPLIDFKRMDRRDHAFRMMKFSVAGDKLDYSGNLLLVPKMPDMQVAQQAQPAGK